MDTVIKKNTIRVFPTNLNTFERDSDELIFHIKSTGWLDPYSIYFNFVVKNEADKIITIDGSGNIKFNIRLLAIQVPLHFNRRQKN